MTCRSKMSGLVLLSVVIAACGDASDLAPTHELAGTTMGTTFNVKLLDPNAEFADAALKDEIEDLLTDLNDSMSTYRPDSEISRFNTASSVDWLAVSKQLCDVVADALAVSDLTEGSFDITVGPLVNLWGFGPDGSISSPPSRKDIETASASVGYRSLHADCSQPAIRKDIPALYVDLSAYAKGYAVDQVANLLDSMGVSDYLVEVGGELRLRGNNAGGKAWAIGIESPAFTSRSVHSIVGLSDAAIATSGDYRNYFEYDGAFYSHTIDPRTAYPVAYRGASVTVLAETAAFADAMATALLVLGPEDGLEFAQREGIAAFFQLRVGGAIEEHASDDFVTMLARR
jgi:thiamine biosynthesis lipoprotein